jgi:hypothetical protein
MDAAGPIESVLDAIPALLRNPNKNLFVTIIHAETDLLPDFAQFTESSGVSRLSEADSSTSRRQRRDRRQSPERLRERAR